MHPQMISALADQIVLEQSLARAETPSASAPARRTRRRRVFRATTAVRRARHLGVFDA